YNNCVNYYKREHSKRRDTFLFIDDDNEYPEALSEITDDEIYELKSDKLNKCLELIDPSDKMILFMKYQDEMSIEEIEEALELGKSAVKMRLNRAKTRLVNIYKNV